ncbi:Solute carrier family 35 member G1 [Holothuria leucospilota]|uniref:Solute carrier family 35 member G1 n=1 Tax=Holothuria leucospilota TaxID=206669 RepID=A0A9Q1B9W9_HOLLE|nr:Solute carrier family 35 member G1 [Holothuria leucospilota]
MTETSVDKDEAVGIPVSYEAENSRTSKITKQLVKHRGLLYAFGATYCYAVPSICVKVLHGKANPNELAFLRAVMICLMSLVVIAYKGIAIKPNSWPELKFFIIHAMFSTMAVACSFFAFQNMRAADAAAIMYAYPALTGLVGRFWLKEPFRLMEVILLMITMSGVVIVAQPSFIFGSREEVTGNTIGHPLAPVVAFTGCICVACVVLTVRAMGKQSIDAVKVLFYYGILGSFFPAVVTSATGQWTVPSCVITRLLILVIGVGSFLANLLFVQALAIENAVYVAMICMNEALVVFVLETIFLGISPEVLSVVGILLILGSSALLTLKRISNSKPKKDDNSQRISEEFSADRNISHTEEVKENLDRS